MKDKASQLYKEGKLEQAISEFQKCLDIDPLNKELNSSLLMNIAIAQCKLGKQDQAIETLNKAIKYKPDYAKAFVKRGEINSLLKNYQEAVADFSRAQEINPGGFGVDGLLKNAIEANKNKEKGNHYTTLGVDKKADEKTITKAYRKLALKWHPDHQKTEHSRAKAETMMREINQAKKILTDKSLRDKYD